MKGENKASVDSFSSSLCDPSLCLSRQPEDVLTENQSIFNSSAMSNPFMIYSSAGISTTIEK